MRLRVLSMVLSCSLLGACVSGPGYYDDGGYYADRGYEDRCHECGTVERVEWVRGGHPQSTGGGALVGALVGGLIGNQVGSGDGRRAATVAGALIGGAVGDEAERDGQRRGRVEIIVRMDDGGRFVFDGSPDELREGDRVEIVGGVPQLL